MVTMAINLWGPGPRGILGGPPIASRVPFTAESLMNNKYETNRSLGLQIGFWSPLGQNGESTWPTKEVTEQVKKDSTR